MYQETSVHPFRTLYINILQIDITENNMQVRMMYLEGGLGQSVDVHGRAVVAAHLARGVEHVRNDLPEKILI